MSDEIKRIHGWPVNTPIPMVGGGVAYVVSRYAYDAAQMCGYKIGNSGFVVPMAWTRDGVVYDGGEQKKSDLNTSYRVLPEPEIPLWTMEDSINLVGKIVVSPNRCLALFISGVGQEPATLDVLPTSIVKRTESYAHLQWHYTFADGTPIPQRRMP